MNLDLRYLGASEVRESGAGATVRFSPNLARSRVFFDGELAHPLRFREAMSALHDVVVGDLRFKKKDKTAYLAWKKDQAQKDADLRRALHDKAKMAEMARIAGEPVPKDLEGDFRKMHRLYWDARVRWANELSRTDPELWRHLVPCDPVVTVAPDVVFFECFSKDESAYACLTVDREAIRSADAGLGTTNVDYSLGLYEHFQTLRSYRSTRLLVDPAGFEVKVEGRDDYREEKIDLPPSWLRGFAQLQAAMTLPSRRVEVPVAALYAILAHLKRHRERTGPRSIRFQLAPGKVPVLVLDPWGLAIPCRGVTPDDVPRAALGAPGAGGSQGPYRAAPVIAAATMPVADRPEEIKIWGRRRLFALARVLPLCDRVEVRLLGTGMPSIWIAHLGEMRLVLALSGWTANDWTSGANLEMLAGPGHVTADARVMAALQGKLFEAQRAPAEALAESVSVPRESALASLHELAKHGQAVYDFAADCYRYREVMPFALSEAVLGPEHPELEAGRRIAAERGREGDPPGAALGRAAALRVQGARHVERGGGRRRRRVQERQVHVLVLLQEPAAGGALPPPGRAQAVRPHSSIGAPAPVSSSIGAPAPIGQPVASAPAAAPAPAPQGAGAGAARGGDLVREGSARRGAGARGRRGQGDLRGRRGRVGSGLRAHAGVQELEGRRAPGRPGSRRRRRRPLGVEPRAADGDAARGGAPRDHARLRSLRGEPFGHGQPGLARVPIARSGVSAERGEAASGSIHPALQGGPTARALHAAAFRRGGSRSTMHPHTRCSFGRRALVRGRTRATLQVSAPHRGSAPR